MNRTFLLPLSALALGSTACADESDTDDGLDISVDTEADTDTDTEADSEAEATLIGVWNATSLTDYANDVYEMPYTYTDNYGGVTYSEVWSMSLTVSTGSVALTSTYDYSETENGVTQQSSESLTYNGSWSGASAPVYSLSFEDGDLNMDCTLAGDDLECVGTASSPDYRRISFDRAGQ